jgi:hypothetical protein
MFKNLFHQQSRDGDSAHAGPSLDLLLNWTDKHIFNLKHLIRPAPESKPRTPFATNLPKEKVSMRNLSGRQMLQVIPKFLPLVANMVLGSRMYDKEFKASSSEASPEFIAELELMARAAGAKDIAYIKVPSNAIFQDKGIPCEYAMVFTVEMDKEPISSAPSFECQLEVMDGYKRMSTISNRLSRHMRKNGFAAYPGTALGGLTDYVHLAELAGLGAIGYHGLLISPGEGARLRLNTIYTNITNLPTLEVKRTSICGCEIFARCATSAFANVRSARFTTNHKPEVMVVSRVSITRRAGITSPSTMAAQSAWRSVRSVRLGTRKFMRVLKAMTVHHSSESPASFNGIGCYRTRERNRSDVASISRLKTKSSSIIFCSSNQAVEQWRNQ